jgi:hypothetical protein
MTDAPPKVERGRPRSRHGVGLVVDLRTTGSRAGPELGREYFEVHDVSHRLVAGAVGVKIVASAADRTVRDELWLHPACGWVKSGCVEVCHAVEEYKCTSIESCGRAAKSA